MSYDLAKHPFFCPWTDPESGVTSYVLAERVAPVQQSFYFTNASVSADERWLWFYTAFPPAPYRTLAAVCLDPDAPRIHHYPSAAFTGASPMVTPEGDAAYFCQGQSVWRQPVDGDPEAVCTLSTSRPRGPGWPTLPACEATWMSL